MAIYMWREYYEPNENTVAYYPLNSTTTVNDMSGNWYNLTNNWSVTFNNLWATTWTQKYLSLGSLMGMPVWNSDRTISIWFNMNAFSYAANYVYAIGAFSSLQLVAMELYSSSTYVDYRNSSLLYSSSMPTWIWTNAVFTNNNWLQTLYIDWQQKWTSSVTLNTQNWILIWKWQWNYYFDWKVSNLIIENKVRTAQEISDYYNQTKANYGL